VDLQTIEKKKEINSHTKDFGVGINKKIKASPMLLKGFIALVATFATLKGHKFYANRARLSKKVKRYKDVLGHISSLKEKKDPPEFIKRRIKKRKSKKRSRLSKKQTKKIVDSSRSLSGFGLNA